MEREVYLDRLLAKFGGSFDVYMPYTIQDTEYKAYAYFHNHQEKYVLVESANLWSTDCYEHVLFMDADSIDGEMFERAKNVIEQYFEPELVRKGEKYPAKNHMYSFLTVVMVGRRFSDNSVSSQIRKYRFEKGYQFNIRGYSMGRMVAVTLEDEKVFCNASAKKSKKAFLEVFGEVKAGKPGFSEICRKQGVTPFKQE